MQHLVANKDITDHIITYLYQCKISLILYPAVISRLDIAFTATRLFSFLSNPFLDYIVATNHYIQYLYSFCYLVILFNGLNNTEEKAFRAYINASFTNNLQDRKSI